MRTSIALDIDSYLKLEGGRNFVARSVSTTSEPDEAVWRLEVSGRLEGV